MIYDSLENIQRYMNIHPRLDEALHYLQVNDWKMLSEGRHLLDGERLFANVDRYVTVAHKALETHSRYVDIQCVVAGEETIGVVPSKALIAKDDYDPARDIAFWDAAQPYTRLPMYPGQFLILFPHEAHAPGMQLTTEQEIHKVVLKVLWEV